MKICTLASSSSGNSTYIETKNYKILIDIGRTKKYIVEKLKEINVDYHDIDYKGKTAIDIGNEGTGISDVVIKNCDFIASIPMYGTVNSLNASVAAGIVIFEAVNQRK